MSNRMALLLAVCVAGTLAALAAAVMPDGGYATAPAMGWEQGA